MITQAEFDAAFPGDGRRVVPPEGPAHAPRLMLIGEAPGGQEEKLGRPFVGKAGKNLDEFLAGVGLVREEIRISNTVKVRPTRVSEKGTVSNRPPNRQELDYFIPLLHREIDDTAPRLIVTLGGTALKALLGGKAVIGACHGQALRVTLLGKEYALYPLYHPASIIYNRSLTEVYAADVRRLREMMDSGVI